MAYTLRALADSELKSRLEALVRQERSDIADIMEHLMEVQRRDLALSWGYPSMFLYCMNGLGYSEYGAHVRLRAASAAVDFPDVLDRLRSGKIGLDSVARLSPYLTEENKVDLLDKADGATKQEVLTLVASLQTEPPPERDVIVPVKPAIPPSKPEVGTSAAEIVPSAPLRFHFTADAELLQLVDSARGLLRHKHPDGRLDDIFKEACKCLLERLERERRPTGTKATSRKGKRVRRVPAAVRREVWQRDGGRCVYASPEGKRCESRDALEYDHVLPWAVGGPSDAAANIRLLCRAHNQWLGRKRFGSRRRPAKVGKE